MSFFKSKFLKINAFSCHNTHVLCYTLINK